MGPVTSKSMRVPPSPSMRASVLPSPPSARGLTITRASGIADKTPAFTAFPASAEERLPLNESMATTTFIIGTSSLISYSITQRERKSMVFILKNFDICIRILVYIPMR